MAWTFHICNTLLTERRYTFITSNLHYSVLRVILHPVQCMFICMPPNGRETSSTRNQVSSFFFLQRNRIARHNDDLSLYCWYQSILETKSWKMQMMTWCYCAIAGCGIDFIDYVNERANQRTPPTWKCTPCYFGCLELYTEVVASTGKQVNGYRRKKQDQQVS